MNNDIVQHISLELNKPVDKAKVFVKKNDTNSRRVQVTLTNNGGMVHLNNVVNAVVKGRKADGRTFYNYCSIIGDTIWFQITTQMINITGEVEAEIEVTWQDESLITTPKFYIIVTNTQYTSEESQNEYTALGQMLAETINERIAAQSAEEAAEDAQAAAESAQAAAENAKTAAINASQTALAAEQITIDTKDYVVNYVQEFIQDLEDNNPTLRLAKAYTDEKTAPLNAAIGNMENLQVPLASDLVTACNNLLAAITQKQKGVSFSNYEAMIIALMAADANAYNVGQSIYIVTLQVPDIWISGIAEETASYIYVDDNTLIADIAAAGGSLQIGLYYISILETQKVDLTSINAAIADIYDRLGYPQ